QAQTPYLIPTSKAPTATTLPPQPPAFPPPPQVVDEPPPYVALMPRPTKSPFQTRYWVRGEYLLWWVKDAPLGVSLVTTGDPNNNPGGELLNSDRRYCDFSGMRLSAGGWFDADSDIGLEANGWFLGRRTNNFFVASDNSG